MSEKKNSLDLSDLNDTPRNYILKKQRSHEIGPISDVDAELSIDDDNPYNRKKTRSFNSFLSIINRSSNGGSSRSNSFVNMFRKKHSSHSLRPITVNEFDDVDEDSRNGVASHIAISPDGQFICTFDSKNLEFKIFDTDTTITYLDKRVTPDGFVKIPKINASNDDSLASYRIEQGALHEYKFDMEYKEYKEIKEIQQRASLSISNSENQNHHSHDEINLENLEKALSQDFHRTESTTRKFPSWSLAISNIMEHQNQHVIFVVISAIVEMDMKKKMSEEEEDEIFPNNSRYRSDEYKISIDENSVHPSESAEDLPDPRELDGTKSEGATAMFRIEFNKNDHSLIRKPSRIFQHTCSNIAGIVKFVKQESNHAFLRNFKLNDQNYLIEEFMTTCCMVINAEGIFKINYFQQHEDAFDIITFNSKLKEEKFSFPKTLEKELKTQYKTKHCMDRLLSCFYHDYFFVDQYKDGTHTIEMYNLSTMEQEQIFIIQHDDKVSSKSSSHVSSVFAISRNKQLIACSNGEKSVTLFWLENGLDVGIKEFGAETRIIFLEFIDDDERLLIITEEDISNIKEDSKATNDENQPIIAENSKSKQKQVESVDNHKLSIIIEERDEIENFNSEKKKEDYANMEHPRPKISRRKSSYKDIEFKKVTKINIWDLFSSTDNATRTGMTGDLFPSKENCHSRMARIPGKLYHMKEDGSVFSIIDHDGFANLVKGEEKDETRSFGCTLFLSFDVTRDQKENMPCDYAKHDEVTKLHKVFSRKENKEIKKSGHNVIVDNKEPWVDVDDYHRTSVYLDKEETLQLIIGHSTVQVWRSLKEEEKSDKKGQKDEPVLEYIWANNIPRECEYDKSRLRIQYLWVGDRAFSLNLYWQYYEGLTLMKVTERLTFPCKDGHVTPVLHACKALEHLNNRKRGVIDYKMMLEFEQLVESTSRIVWRFVKKKPEVFKLMDVRYNVMTHLVRGGCNYLVKFILFGDLANEELKDDKKGSKKKKKDDDKSRNKNKRILHIPKTKKWISELEPQIKISESLETKATCSDFSYRFFYFISEILLWFYLLITCKKKNKRRAKKTKKKSKRNAVIPTTDLEWAIEHCKDKERKDAVVVGYLLEYYSENALHHIGWMITISKALPLLYRYNLNYYVKPLFYKDCFGDKELTHYDPSEIIPEHSRPRRNKMKDFKAFKPFTKIVSDKNNKPFIQKLFEFIIVKLPRYYINFVDNFDNDRAPPPVALRIVPLPNFTVDNIPRDHIKYDWLSNLIRLLKILIIPRGYIIGKEDKKLLSPFVQVVRYEKDNDIFDNPAMEAIIDFRWRAARNYFLQIFAGFVAYAVCFGVIVWAYMSKLEATGNLIIFLMCVIGCFYYLAYYLIAVELKQAWHHGLRESLNVSNLFDIVSIVTPCVVMSIFVASSFQLSDGFAHVENNTGIIVCVSFTMLLIWCEMLLYLRLLSEMAKYIYFVIIIFSTVYPFLIFMFLVITAFAHAFFLLLSNPDMNTIKPRINSFSMVNTTSEETLDIQLNSNFDPTSVTDNPFSSFLASFEAAYFWINGEWTQRDDWDYWAVEVLSLVASILLVTVLQNMLIAFMGGVYEEAAEKGRDALLRYRATLISDYEALEDVRFWPREQDPQFIFYVGHSNSFEEWTEKRKDFKGNLYQKYESRASYKKYKFQEMPSDKNSLLVYKMDKKDCSNSSLSSSSDDGRIVPGSTSKLSENFTDFQQNINNKLVDMDQKIDTKIDGLKKEMRDFFTEFMKKLDTFEKHEQES